MASLKALESAAVLALAFPFGPLRESAYGTLIQADWASAMSVARGIPEVTG
jgi:hypothetical protein